MSELARRQWEAENEVKSSSEFDKLYQFDHAAHQALMSSKPWRKELRTQTCLYVYVNVFVCVCVFVFERLCVCLYECWPSSFDPLHSNRFFLIFQCKLL